MPPQVIDPLEVVDVQNHQSYRAAFARGIGRDACHVFVERAAVGKPRQRVVTGCVLQGLELPFQLAPLDQPRRSGSIARRDTVHDASIARHKVAHLLEADEGERRAILTAGGDTGRLQLHELGALKLEADALIAFEDLGHDAHGGLARDVEHIPERSTLQVFEVHGEGSAEGLVGHRHRTVTAQNERGVRQHGDEVAERRRADVRRCGEGRRRQDDFPLEGVLGLGLARHGGLGL